MIKHNRPPSSVSVSACLGEAQARIAPPPLAVRSPIASGREHSSADCAARLLPNRVPNAMSMVESGIRSSSLVKHTVKSMFTNPASGSLSWIEDTTARCDAWSKVCATITTSCIPLLHRCAAIVAAIAPGGRVCGCIARENGECELGNLCCLVLGQRGQRLQLDKSLTRR